MSERAAALTPSIIEFPESSLFLSVEIYVKAAFVPLRNVYTA